MKSKSKKFTIKNCLICGKEIKVTITKKPRNYKKYCARCIKKRKYDSTKRHFEIKSLKEILNSRTQKNLKI